MKVLVTGANGFLGSWLTRKLLEDGYEVVVLLRKSSDLSLIKDLKVEKCIGDITDLTSIKNALSNSNIEIVFHLAGYVGYSHQELQLMEKVNVQGTINVVNAILEINPAIKLLHLSSVVTIGASFTEQTILNETSIYNMHKYNFGYFETKKSAEDYILKAVKERALQAIIVNPSTIYGAGDAQKGSRSTQLKVTKGKMLFYPNGGVSVVAVEDVVNAIVTATRKGRIGERYILSGENLYLREVFQMIADVAKSLPPKYLMPSFCLELIACLDDFLSLFNLKGPIPAERARVAKLFHWFDNSKAKKELDFNPMPARIAIERSVQWALQNRS